MPMKIENMVKPLIVCDHCDEHIEDAYLANVEWRRDDSAELFYLHKHCHDDFCKGERLMWMPLTDFLVFLQNNSGFCRSKQARAKVGLPELQVKDLRRHFAIDLAENGANMHDIQQVLGHASVATTERHYAQFSPKHSAKKILRVLQGGKAAEPEEETKRKQGEKVLRKVR